MDKSVYDKVVLKIIDKLEGGYYHPDMLKDGRVKDQRYAGSGETMFGIDRMAGGTNNLSPAGKKFWAIIDAANARKNWPWLYLGGPLNEQLKVLAGDIMYPVFLYYFNLNFSPLAKSLVSADPRLMFHFIYSTWNGPGWFHYFAAIFNDWTAKGNTDSDSLVKLCINARSSSTSSLMAQGGRKIALFIDELKKKRATMDLPESSSSPEALSPSEQPTNTKT